MIYPQKIEQALRFASEKHKNQKRKISECPYIIHPVMVFHIISRFTQDIDTLCAAILHDTVEDTNTSLTEIEEVFGNRVGYLVDILSEDKSLPHKEMKEKYFSRMYAENDKDVFLVKSADIIYNLRDLVSTIREFGYEKVSKKFNFSTIIERLHNVYSMFMEKWPENPLLSELRLSSDILKAAEEYKGNIQYEISCGVIPVYKNKDNEKEYLIVQLHAGHWSFPKGHQDLGETYLKTAKRELLEETGLICKSIDEQNIFSESYIVRRPEKIIHKTVYYFAGYVDTQIVNIQIDEIADSFWGNAEQVLEKITHKESKDLFKKALLISK